MIRIHPFPFPRLALVAVAFALVLSACDSSELAADAAVSDVEAAEAAEIVGSALADTDGGLMASFADLTAGVSASGLGDPAAVRVGHDRQRDGDRRRHRACRGGERALEYDLTTGTHTLSYDCSVETEQLSKTLSSELAYVFRNGDDGFMARPWANWDAVASVGFRGSKTGSLSATRANGASIASSFEQAGSWMLTDLIGDGAAQLAGSQTRHGTRTRTFGDSTATRAFTVELASDDIQIRNSDDGLTRAVTGTLTYSAVIEIDTPRKTERKTIEGTIQLDGSGRALLRVFGLRNVYRISLFDGAAASA